MNRPSITTLGQLKASNPAYRSVREEVRQNLVAALKAKEELFPGIVGYEKTVIPQVINALLSKHDILLLGLRGQAKTRLLRSLVRFIDEWSPKVAGSPLNEHPLHPVLPGTRDRIAEMGDDTPIEWVHQTDRFQEKLATPDVSIADLIGDIDPIKASREKLDLSDERVIHYGIIPRTSRGVFCINELPDLHARIQVGLLNILEEKDLQIRGFPIRLELDILMVFTANPEDYTNRGSIITPLKDRIGSQIITHYPQDVDQAIRITDQEAHIHEGNEVVIPHFYREIIEHIAIQARESDMVDQTSGVSARLPISALELLTSNIERRRLMVDDDTNVPRLCDLLNLIPAVTGKVELVYEGEQEGPSIVAEKIIGKAVNTVFQKYFPPVREDRRSKEETHHYKAILKWFNAGNNVEITDHEPWKNEQKELLEVNGLQELVRKHLKTDSPQEEMAAMEIVLEGLHQHSMLSRDGLEGAVVFGDMFQHMVSDL